MEATVNSLIASDQDPIFGKSFAWSPHGYGYHIMPKDEPTYIITEEALDHLKGGHVISRAKLTKLQQIVRIKGKPGSGAPAEIRLSHL
jgi:hypothetical protein